MSSTVWPSESARAVCLTAADDLIQAASDRDLSAEAFDALSSRLLGLVSAHDADLGELLATRIGDARVSVGDSAGSVSRAAALAAAAIAMLPGNPERALSLGRAALGDRATEEVMRLAIVLSGVDAKRGDALFSSAIAVTLRRPQQQIGEVSIVASYIGSKGVSALENVPTDQVRAFLELAVRLIESTQLDDAASSDAYFLGRAIVSAVSRYLPERAATLDSRLAVLSRSQGFQQSAEASNRRESSADTNPHFVAGLAAIDRGDLKALHAEAGVLDRDEQRSALYLLAARKAMSDDRLSDAAMLVEHIPVLAARSAGYRILARAEHDANDRGAMSSALTAAESAALKETSTIWRVTALAAVADAWAGVDRVRAAQSLSTLVGEVNKATLKVDDKQPSLTEAESNRRNLYAAFERLAASDFEGALLTARGLDSKAFRAFAELAVCRAGSAHGDGDDGTPEDGDGNE